MCRRQSLGFRTLSSVELMLQYDHDLPSLLAKHACESSLLAPGGARAAGGPGTTAPTASIAGGVRSAAGGGVGRASRAVVVVGATIGVGVVVRAIPTRV